MSNGKILNIHQFVQNVVQKCLKRYTRDSTSSPHADLEISARIACDYILRGYLRVARDGTHLQIRVHR